MAEPIPTLRCCAVWPQLEPDGPEQIGSDNRQRKICANQKFKRPRDGQFFVIKETLSEAVVFLFWVRFDLRSWQAFFPADAGD
jgi:hypothetical protein